jgi:hypothetical protein
MIPYLRCQSASPQFTPPRSPSHANRHVRQGPRAAARPPPPACRRRGRRAAAGAAAALQGARRGGGLLRAGFGPVAHGTRRRRPPQSLAGVGRRRRRRRRRRLSAVGRRRRRRRRRLSAVGRRRRRPPPPVDRCIGIRSPGRGMSAFGVRRRSGRVEVHCSRLLLSYRTVSGASGVLSPVYCLYYQNALGSCGGELSLARLPQYGLLHRLWRVLLCWASVMRFRPTRARPSRARLSLVV